MPIDHGRQLTAAVPFAESSTDADITSQHRQRFLLELSDRLRPLADPLAVQREATRALGEHLGASRVGYAEILNDGETSLVTVNYTNGVRGIDGRIRVADYSTTLLRALRAGQTVARGDVAAAPDLTEAERAAHASLEIGATVDIPLLKQGRLVAVLFMHFRERHHFTTEELALLDALAERTWDAVERARAEAALRASEARLRLALELAEMGIWELSLTDRSGYLDARAAEIMGLPAGPFDDVARAQEARTHPDDLAAMQSAVKRGIASGVPFDLSYRAVHPRRQCPPRRLTRPRAARTHRPASAPGGDQPGRHHGARGCRSPGADVCGQ